MKRRSHQLSSSCVRGASLSFQIFCANFHHKCSLNFNSSFSEMHTHSDWLREWVYQVESSMCAHTAPHRLTHYSRIASTDVDRLKPQNKISAKSTAIKIKAALNEKQKQKKWTKKETKNERNAKGTRKSCRRRCRCRFDKDMEAESAMSLSLSQSHSNEHHFQFYSMSFLDFGRIFYADCHCFHSNSIHWIAFIRTPTMTTRWRRRQRCRR